MKAHILFISSLHLTMSSCFGNHLMEIHTFLQLGFLLHVHSLLKSSSHISSLKRFNCRYHPVSYESFNIRRFLENTTVEFFDETILPLPRFEPRTSCSVVHCDDHQTKVPVLNLKIQKYLCLINVHQSRLLIIKLRFIYTS